ncbi:methionine aminotransferase [Nonlabens ponticola]|uniref:Aminotransferase class I/II-fold pyridoxal phosphate-dependent enzyme n=1 Tax=Nonlabens ponticola TaxID=2496866 RepID=A0A3S9MV97_9FLAO|nr:methionine aminotransferase [Nonlabens ponticola]AZQ43101.1 aminotransferase class I/II-fold pyridoxal phosphate-dependent enzyme [Nonlabens ponticola]
MIPSKLPNLPTSIFAEMSELAAQHGALNLSQGFPSFHAAQELKDLAAQAIQNNHNQYAPMMGIQELRIAIAQMMQSQHSVAYDPMSEICITAGATQAIFTAIQATIFAGDEVIIFSPAYDCYEPAIKIAGGVVVPVPMQLPDFTIDWDLVKSKVTAKTKMIIINSPHNPSGALLQDADLKQLQQIAVENDLLILSDEVYEFMVFNDHEHLSACRYPELKERCFITGSFGKTFHVTGWKLGYILAPPRLMKEFLKIHQQVIFCINRPIQHAVANYLQNPSTYQDLGKFYQRKRDLFLNLIKDSRFKFKPSASTYFQLLDYSSITDEHDYAFAKALTINHKIAAIPISVFMEGRDPKMLRFCFAKEDEELVAAAKILNQI